MAAYKVATTLQQDGQLTLEHLPFRAGEQVDVLIVPAAARNGAGPTDTLRGTVLGYDDPTDPVAASDWEAST